MRFGKASGKRGWVAAGSNLKDQTQNKRKVKKN